MLLILLMGPPGSGKGSLAHALVQRHGFVHFSTGKLFRVKKDKESTTTSGDLVVDDYVNNLALDELNRIFEIDPNSKIILDGYPRTRIQAEFIKNHYPISKVFYLSNVSHEFIIKRLNNRLLCEKEDHSFNLIYHPPKVAGICDYDGSRLYRRPDDKSEIVEKRLEIYEESTKPLVDYYRTQSEFVEIDASRDLEEILKSLQEHIKPFI